MPLSSVRASTALPRSRSTHLGPLWLCSTDTGRWGHFLGQYECAGEHNGAPYYKQTGGSRYLYRDAQTAWRAGWGLGGEDHQCVLYHPPTTGDTPPLSGWQYLAGGQYYDDPTLVLTPGPLSLPCTITLQYHYLAAKYPFHLGTFTKTDQWSWGRPVFRNQAGKLLYCSFWVGGWWRVGDTTNGRGDIWSWESAGLWPPQRAEWRYDWRDDAVITITTSIQQ